MNQNSLAMCPGCGLMLPVRQLSPNNRYNASGECLELFAQLSGYTLSLNDPAFIHQVIVDAYGAQHSGGISKNITTIFALIGLCLLVEHHYTGRQVQKVHMRIPKQTWPRLEPPKLAGLITVMNVLQVDDSVQKINQIQAWARSVWNSWFEHHNWVRQQTQAYI